LTDEQLELIHRAIDGETTAEESGRLRDLLAADEEARRCHDELRGLTHRLKHIEPVDPPSDLRADILRSIRRGVRPEPGGTRVGAIRRLVDLLRPGHAYAFATGLAAGIVLLAFLSADQMPELDESLASGTLLRPAPSAHVETLDRVQLDSVGARGLVVARRANGTVWLDIDVVSEETVELELEPGDGSWSPLGFEQLQPGADVTMLANRLSVRHRGENHYRIAFAESTSPIRVTLRTGLGAEVERVVNTTGPEGPNSSVTRSATPPGP